MDAVLEQLVVERLAQAGLEDAVADLVLAACGGPEELQLALGGEAPTRAAPAGQLALEPRDLGTYLASVRVAGFRGIGAPVTLELHPGPGLTVVAGRNGSGKSSFAEALEMLMTGVNSRWADRTKVWTEGWQNLHHDGGTEVEAHLLVEGEPGSTRLRRRWPAASALAPGECEVATPAGASSLDELGWTVAVSRYRPFLSFNELGQMFDKNATMYAALSAILGLEDVEALAGTLRDARLVRDRAARAVREATAALRGRVAAVEDPRARTVEAALTATPADLDAIELVLAGADDRDEGGLGDLQALVSLRVPSAADLDERIAAFETARDAVGALAGTGAGRAASLSALLQRAVDHHEHHAGADCPVCGTAGAIGDDWMLRTVKEIARLDAEAREVETATAAERAARRAIADLLAPVPPAAVGAARELDLDPGEVELAWTRWADERTELDDPSSRERLRATAERLRVAAATLGRAAQAELDRREDAWRPVARLIAEWLPGARAAAGAGDVAKRLKAAEDWVKATAADLRAARIAPIADAAKANWELLRQESNVSLERLELRQAGNQRSAVVDVRVDGTDASAFGVMSQGELHGLAVSVFLPRASLPESPFRFAVIDDPVQSMDPAKVDGLARALARAAQTRQLVVFTHDERLPEALRRLGLPATVLEVTRRPGSVVEVRAGTDPVERHLDDARALVRSDVPAAVVGRVLPGFCRGAIEAACTQVVRRRRLARGDSHARVETALDEATTLYTFLSLALFDEPGRGGEVLASVNNRYGRAAGDAVIGANRGVHELLGGDLRDFVRDTGILARRLAELT